MIVINIVVAINLSSNNVDEIRDKVDVVIALAHTGVGADAIAVGQDSISNISHTSGIDAYIDGHSHTYLPSKEVTNKVGKTCLLTQTGSYLTHFGKLTISKNNAVAVEMIDDTNFVNQDVHQLEMHLINEVQEQMKTKIATLENPLYIVNAEDQKQRIIRARETNLGNFTSDSIYWYFNEYKDIDCDLALVNGGGIRDNIFAKDVTYMDAKTVFPFGNQICLVKVKGSVIKDALEMGSCVIGQWDEVADRPAEFGGFFHPAGLKYDISASTVSSVTLDDTGMFVSVDGEYKVRNIEIYNKELQRYESLDEDKEYTVGGYNYILRNDGNGMRMFHDSLNIVDYVAEDYIALAEFMKSFDNGVINNANSPLKGYTNMLYDYETPTGSGRINIIA